MPVSIVYLDIKPEKIEEFKTVALENCVNSRKEEGNISFDLLAQKDESDKFVLVENFRDKAAIEFHKTTAHYQKWAAMMEECAASPRYKTVYEMVEE